MKSKVPVPIKPNLIDRKIEEQIRQRALYQLS
jgi:hypothetical protein